MTNKQSSEAKRIIQSYERRFRSNKDFSEIYNPLNPDNVICFLENYRHITDIMRNNLGYNFTEKKYLDVGCGHTGRNIFLFMKLGVPPENISGNAAFSTAVSCGSR